MTEELIVPTTADNEPHVIDHNLTYLRWIINRHSHMDILDENKRSRVLSMLTLAITEDPFCFMRITLYLANSRNRHQELVYRAVIHFIGTMFPEIALANLELFTSLGKKDDAIYFVQCPNIAERAVKWTQHKAKSDVDFETLCSGKLIGNPIKRRARYKVKIGKKYKLTPLLEKILVDPLYNGIAA